MMGYRVVGMCVGEKFAIDRVQGITQPNPTIARPSHVPVYLIYIPGCRYAS